MREEADRKWKQCVMIWGWGEETPVFYFVFLLFAFVDKVTVTGGSGYQMTINRSNK